ncbi:MAG: hypothetical protein ABL921_14145 [Pirellula sp.]
MSVRRNQKYVDREVQTSLLKRICAHWVLFMFANIVAITLWTRFLETPLDPWSDTIRLASNRIIPFAMVSMALFPVFVWDAIKLSNRFAGPIIRVRKVLAQIANGQIPKPIEFRNGDFWKSLAHDLNRAFLFRVLPETKRTDEGV